MRIVWKDSGKPEAYKQMKYRGFYITGTPRGWEIDVPDDSNLYKSHYCAENAIDAHYGDFGRHGTEKRTHYGMQVVGVKDEGRI